VIVAAGSLLRARARPRFRVRASAFPEPSSPPTLGGWFFKVEAGHGVLGSVDGHDFMSGSGLLSSSSSFSLPLRIAKNFVPGQPGPFPVPPYFAVMCIAAPRYVSPLLAASQRWCDSVFGAGFLFGEFSLFGRISFFHRICVVDFALGIQPKM